MFMIDIQCLSKTYLIKKSVSLFSSETIEITGISDVNLQVNQGEVIGIVGNNGAGKSTLLKCIAGLIHPTCGTITVMGYNPHEKSKNFLSEISFISGRRDSLLWDLPVIDSFKLHCHVYHIHKPLINTRIEQALEAFDLKTLIQRQTKTLSLGERMRIELAKATLHDPEIFILDEPTLGLDLKSQTRLRNYIKNLSSQRNRTILISSHNMDDIKSLSSRIVEIDGGQLKELRRGLEEYTQKYVNMKEA
ncbi:ATP-binding cassette domain-containing protein [Photobacterium sp. GJ3]|uniref:ATP-binding cassette domain-containing protein n=1 Tax=Photobacterium sp. GJ3 TaxID=2829502 RepID=UPI001B8B4EDF|nr:ATP-binding cassette domain-containing protein [Photobacterium sp. GJ3]QUJ67325.1 ATP-binding cassette domain-containing protein [Photobacterium sp. GJ3]